MPAKLTSQMVAVIAIVLAFVAFMVSRGLSTFDAATTGAGTLVGLVIVALMRPGGGGGGGSGDAPVTP